MLALTAPRVHAANAYMYRKLGLDAATFRRSDALLARALEGGQHLTREELRVVFQSSGIPADGEFRMDYLMMRAELDGVVCSGPRRGNQSTYALLDERVAATGVTTRERAAALLAERFFRSRGPATVHDFAKWSGLTIVEARTGLEAATERFECEQLDDKTYWFAAPNGKTTQRRQPTVHLLSIYDEYVSGYKDRSAIVSAANGARLMAMGNALTSIVVIDGQISGTWKRRLDRESVAIEIVMFDRATTSDDRALEIAVTRYGTFLGLAATRA
jgi:hypothetical protein